MKSLCLVLVLGLSMPGCSMFNRRGGQDRTYTKYLKQLKASREKQRRTIRQRAEMPALRTPAPSEETVQISQGE